MLLGIALHIMMTLLIYITLLIFDFRCWQLKHNIQITKHKM